MGDMLSRAARLKDVSWLPQMDTSGSEQATRLSEEDEDTLRKALYQMFDLQPLELLVL